MSDILLLTQMNGREIAVFADSIDILYAAPEGDRTVIGLKGGEDNHIIVREKYEDILHTIYQANVTAWRIRPAPPGNGSVVELSEGE